MTSASAGIASEGNATQHEPDVQAIPRWAPMARVVDSNRFQLLISGVIVANAVVLGLETYPAIEERFGDTLAMVNEAFYVIFVIELLCRIASYGRQPWNFFRSGWNVFDFIVIGGALVPALRAEAEILRLLRLARIVRLMRFLPDARVIIATMANALPSIFSMLVLTVLIMFIYGILGWSLFGQDLPSEWGTIGQSMLTLFVLLTLENFPVYLEQAQPFSPFATLFFLSYVMIAGFVVLNLVVGIVIGAMEKAREAEAIRVRKDTVDDHTKLIHHVIAIRDQLDEIEAEVEALRRRGEG
ncbi:MAG: ion transporter [Actinomycetales bacterium]|nr:ion transporter [Actinomycetales bacterium]